MRTKRSSPCHPPDLPNCSALSHQLHSYVEGERLIMVKRCFLRVHLLKNLIFNR